MRGNNGRIVGGTMIEKGYCVIVRNFWAQCVPFETVGAECEKDTVPIYKIRLPNGEIEEFNEPDLKHTKEEVEKICEKINEEHKEDRELLLQALPWIEKIRERFEYE